MSEHHDDVLTVNIRDFCRRSGLSRYQAYRMLNRGTLEGIKIGGNRLILWDSYQQLVDSLRVPPKQRAPST